MARIRTIKPELWTDEAFTECSVSARLLFVGALNFANDYGVLSDSPKRLKMQVFPADSFDVEGLIDELIFHGLWERAEHPATGRKVLLIRGFAKHQVVNRPNLGEYGNPAKWHEPSTTTPTPLTDDSVSAHPRKGREWNGMEQEGKEILADDASGAAVEIPEPHEDDQRICDHLADAIEIRTQKRPKQSAKWIESARLLRERGSTDWEQPTPVELEMILRAIDWAMSNEFWATNIRSPNALRKHWSRLVDQSLQEKRTGKPPVNPGAGVDLYDQLVESGHMT